MSEPTEPTSETPAVCVTLYLENVKGARHLKVRGASNKAYEFRWHEGHQKIVREYTSLAQFTREELDIRKARNAANVICTKLGATNLVLQAKESVAALIEARRSLTATTRIAALRAIAETVDAALLELQTPPDEEPAPPDAPQPPAVEKAPLSKAEEVDAALSRRPERAWTDEKGTPIEPAPPLEITPDTLTKPVRAGGAHTHAELMQGEWPAVQEIARTLGIPLTKDGRGIKGRPKLVEEILAKEATPNP